MLVEVTIQVENSVISYLGTPVYLLASLHRYCKQQKETVMNKITPSVQRVD